MFVIAGVLVLTGASGAFAVYSGKEALLGGGDRDGPALSGVACTTVETLKMRRNGQRWIRKYVSTEEAGGVNRVRTALRITGQLANAEKADLYQVVVLDHEGPHERARRRGPAIGAEVLFAPDPGKVPGMTTPFVARYKKGDANLAGLFHGREVSLPAEEIRSTLTAMDDKSDCFDPIAAAAEAEAGAEGSPAGGHGEEAASDHGEEVAPAHEQAASGEKGFLGSMIAMVFGEAGPDSQVEVADHADGVQDASVAHNEKPPVGAGGHEGGETH
ncbi:hypothetical protein ASD31_18580 [Rhizobium sp. Root482]|nr:hypothetical protein ASD31_18580 [Rhizobium sp. Root482]